jgi:hypothetical protein
MANVWLSPPDWTHPAALLQNITTRHKEETVLSSKKLVIVAIGILIVGTGLLLGQRTYNAPSTAEQAGPTEFDTTNQLDQVDREATAGTEPGSNVTSSIKPELTGLPLATRGPDDSPTGTSADDLTATLPSLSISTSALTEGLIGELQTPTGRLAPDVIANPLQFSNIRIFRNNDSGTFSVQANMKNLGTTFLNNLVLSWRILDSSGQVLDQGQFTWPNLAPNETVTTTFAGTAVFLDTWSRMEFTQLQ